MSLADFIYTDVQQETASIRPINAFSFENEAVHFVCSNNETHFSPILSISGNLYYRANLPEGYYFVDNVLVLPKVTMDDDGITIQCIYLNSTYRKSSEIATLKAYPGIVAIAIFLVMSLLKVSLTLLTLGIHTYIVSEKLL